MKKFDINNICLDKACGEILAQITLKSGETIEVVSLGRDGGAYIIGHNDGGDLVSCVCSDNGPDGVRSDLEAINNAVTDEGAANLRDVFDGWENGMGGSPFDVSAFDVEGGCGSWWILS